MQFPESLKSSTMDALDAGMALWPRPRPGAELLQGARIIAHRGLVSEAAPENTMKAFEAASACGAWGIEFDIRFSSCGLPVIHHDSNLRRIFKHDSVIADSTFENLVKAAPDFTSFDQILDRYAGKTHMMIEIKDTFDTMTAQKLSSLKERLARLEPVRDYHIMSLNETVLKKFDFVPREAWIPIAEFDVAKISKFATDQNTGSLAGQYLLLSKRYIDRHREAGRKIGTGFSNSRSVLFREINRGVDWIFSDRADHVVDVIRQELKKAR